LTLCAEELIELSQPSAGSLRDRHAVALKGNAVASGEVLSRIGERPSDRHHAREGIV
jgi:hypothetical protein